MKSAFQNAARWLRPRLEQSLGIKISRLDSGKFFYRDLANLRKWSPNDVIFDVGANDGRSAIRLQQVLPSPRIYSFEPVASSYGELVARTAALPNVQPFHLALGARSGSETIYLNELSSTNSFEKEWAPAIGSEIVTVSTVDKVMAQEGIDFIHFLKIDTEGHDLEVLKGAHAALSGSKVAIVQVEAGLDQMQRPMPSLEAFRLHLAPMGYYLYGIYNQDRIIASPPSHWASDLRRDYGPRVLATCDAVFVQAQLDR